MWRRMLRLLGRKGSAVGANLRPPAPFERAVHTAEGDLYWVAEPAILLRDVAPPSILDLARGLAPAGAEAPIEVATPALPPEAATPPLRPEAATPVLRPEAATPALPPEAEPLLPELSIEDVEPLGDVDEDGPVGEPDSTPPVTEPAPPTSAPEVPLAIAPAPAAPPDVPPDGLYVQGGPSGPVAIAALLYEVPDGQAPDKLTLKLAPAASPPSPAPAAPPAAPAAPALQACTIKSGEFNSEQNGPWQDAPAADCAHGAAGTFDSSARTISFAVGPLASSGSTTGRLAVAIVKNHGWITVVLSFASRVAVCTLSVAWAEPEQEAETERIREGADGRPGLGDLDCGEPSVRSSRWRQAGTRCRGSRRPFRRCSARRLG